MDRRPLALLMVVVMMSPLTGEHCASSSASTQEGTRHAEAQIVEPDHLTSVPEQSDIWWDPYSKWWDVTTLDMDRNGIHDSIQEAVALSTSAYPSPEPSLTPTGRFCYRWGSRFDKSCLWWTPSFWAPSIRPRQ